MAEVPRWRLTADWFDVCRCRVPCGCTFAQAPDEGQCDGILAWHVREGSYGDVTLDGLNVVAVGSFEGNIWTGEAKPSMGFFIDERAAERQREALTGPTAPAGARVQVHNAPGAEAGPGQVATWATAREDEVEAFGFKWSWPGRSSKHFPFDWSGPDEA
ncbi:MAG TPA: DUF1326 domain-containing protein [Thermoleophilaceae bacterium]|jgi:hypothetical protein|nr:DUF1326 domain-containing protein [Thermoleophilaceae bacterium]